MKKTFILASAALFALASCTKEIETVPETVAACEKFTASIEQGIETKTKLGDNGLDVLWKVGDAISINGCTYTADKGGAQSPFTASGAAATANTSSPKYSAIYPASMADYVLPDVQEYKEGSKFKSMPMYAESNTIDLSFKNICAVLKVSVPSSITTVRSIEVSSSNRALSGAFTISSDNVLELTDTTDHYNNTMTLECGAGVANPGIFYIAIPAGKYKELKITVCDGANNYSMTTKSGKYITVERNKMYPISFTVKEETTAENCFRFTALTDGCTLETHSYLTDEYRDVLHNDPVEDEEPQQQIIEFQYSLDGGKNWGNSGSSMKLNLNKGAVVCVKSADAVNGFNDWGMDYECMPTPAANVFAITSGKMKVSGDIITLLNRQDKSDRSVGGNDTYGGSGSAFAFLFVGCGDHLVSARDLILPETSGYKCYYSMFSGCTALKEAPVLPATTLAGDSYKSMFNGCSSLNYIKMLATDISASGCMANWVSGVASTGTFVKNPAATWNVVGVDGVPEGWVTTYDSDDESDIDHEYVDLGLSVKWATCNIGATQPEDYGNYYAWGEIAAKSDCSWSNYKWCSGTSSTLTKYNVSSTYGTVDKKTVLEAGDDVASVVWGEGWRMPTYDEWKELVQNCTFVNTTLNGVTGRLVTSRKEGYTDKSIFLPAAGCLNGTTFSNVGSDGHYWSSSLNTNVPAHGIQLYFYGETTNGPGSSNNRYAGQSIRPVHE